jgi:hypothetical protein
MQTPLRGIANKDACKASNTEEPGAVIPHAGICKHIVIHKSKSSRQNNNMRFL